MNTLSKNITSEFFSSAEDFYKLQKHWGNLVNSERKNELKAAHYLLYAVLRGKDWRKAFTPLSNQRKLANGAFYNWGLLRALYQLHHEPAAILLEPLAEVVTPAMLDSVRQKVPFARTLFKYEPTDYKPGDFPLEAYQLPLTAAKGQ